MLTATTKALLVKVATAADGHPLFVQCSPPVGSFTSTWRVKVVCAKRVFDAPFVRGGRSHDKCVCEARSRVNAMKRAQEVARHLESLGIRATAEH